MARLVPFFMLAFAGTFVLVQAREYASIVEAAKANKLKLFVEMSDKAGFTPQLASPAFIGTVFAPTDAAIEEALSIAGITKKELYANNTLLVDVIMYHVVPGQAVMSDHLKNDGVYTSMRGKPLTITKSLGGDVAVNSGSTATVIEKDQKAGAAVFNIVDNLLVPADELASLNLQQADTVKFFTTIEEAVGSDDSLITFSQALFDLSSANNKTDAAKLAAYLTDPNTVATVFAPTDDTWDTLGQMSAYYTGNASAITDNTSQVVNLLKYHIIPDRALRASQLKNNSVLTMWNGETVKVHVTDKPARKVAEQIVQERAVVSAKISGIDPSMHIIISPNSDGDEATITSADVVAGKSYIHKIDAVLIPQSTLEYLDSFTADAGKNHTKNATVAEAFAGNATANASRTANGTVREGTAAGNTTALANTITPRNGATQLAASVLLSAYGLLASMLLLW